MDKEIELLTCSCCGRGVWNTPEDNADYDHPEHHDTGFGTCRGCGGDPKAKTFWKRMGWGAEMFYKARFKSLREALSPENQARFDAMPVQKKVAVIARLIEEGKMI
jgi:hypothetical protein